MTAPAIAPPSFFTPKEGFQTEAISAGEFEVALGGSKGPGKTAVLTLLPFRNCHIPDGQALLLRETWGEAVDLIKRVKHWTRHYPVKYRPTYKGSPTPVFTWPSGHQLHIGHGRTVEDLQQYQGREYYYIGVDEGANLKDERMVTTLTAEIRSPVPGLPRWFRISGNPGFKGHVWFKRRYITPTEGGTRIYWEKMEVPDRPTLWLSRRFIGGHVWDNPIYSNDKQYLAQLYALPERQRRRLLYGDWDTLGGVAFDELDERVHLIAPFAIPAHWQTFAGFDWGFAHLFSYVKIAKSEDNPPTYYVIGAVRGYRVKDSAMADRIKRYDPDATKHMIYAGTDAFSGSDAKLDRYTPSTADRFQDAGLILHHAIVSRILCRRYLQELLAWRGMGKDGRDGWPRLYFFNTPDVRPVFEAVQSAIEDEHDPEDILKWDYNPETDAAGDDDLEALWHAIASDLGPSAETWVPAHRQFMTTAQYELEWSRAQQRVVTLPANAPGTGWIPL